MTAQYVPVGFLKDALEIDGTDDRSDLALESIINSASAAVDAFCGRTFSLTGTTLAPVERVYDTTGGLLVIDDLVELVGVEYESGDTWVAIDVTTVTLLPRNAAADGQPYTMIRTRSGQAFPDVIRVSGTWGWPEVPPQVQDATLLQAIRLRKSKDVPTGVVGGADFMGTMRLSGDLHPDAQTLLQPLRRISLG